MRPSLSILLVWLLALLLGHLAAAADDPFAPAGSAPKTAPPKTAPPTPPPAPEVPAASETAGQEERRPAERLPAPLNNLASNFAELEKTGYFAVTDVAFGRSEDFGDEAVIWTIKVLKPITCRHVTILMRRFSDVRFYHAEEKTEKELYSGELYFSSRIAEGAVHGEILRQDMEFEAWVLLDPEQVIMLVREKADAVVFHEPQTVHVPLPGVDRTPWNKASGSSIPRWFSKAKPSK